MRDLGLTQSGPNDQNIMARAYKKWSKSTENEVHSGSQDFDLSRPLDFEHLGPNKNNGRILVAKCQILSMAKHLKPKTLWMNEVTMDKSQRMIPIMRRQLQHMVSG